MKAVAFVVWAVMEYACKWTGHRVFLCWNGAGSRLWYWAYTYGEVQP